MKYSLLLLLSIFFLSFGVLNYEKINNGVLNWKERQLSWQDYKIVDMGLNEHSANTKTRIKVNCNTKGDYLECSINSLFERSKSWVVKDSKSEYLLNHEQRHFDITEYYSRNLRQRLINHKFNSFNSLELELKIMYNSCDYSKDSLQDLYDYETSHSLISNSQEYWNAKIDSMLDSKKSFSNPTFNLDVKYLHKP